MGWWSENIYGGDAPLTWQEEIYKFCNTEVYGKDNKVQPISSDVLSEKIEDILEFIENKSTDLNHKNIGFQVLGAIIMHSGFDIDESDDLRSIIIEASENDDYAKENLVRRNVLKNFKKLIKEYDPSQPVNVIAINVFEQNDDSDDQIAKEFKEIFGLMKARIKKLESGIEEKSGIKEYDEGYEVASREEIDFLTDFMELMSKMEMMGVLFEKISQGIVGNPVSGSPSEPMAKNASISAGSGKDVMPG